MGLACEQMSLSDGKCDYYTEGEEGFDDMGYDEQGYCYASDDPYPGDSCCSYNPSLDGSYCDRCGEYAGDRETGEGSECECDE